MGCNPSPVNKEEAIVDEDALDEIFFQDQGYPFYPQQKKSCQSCMNQSLI
jgi:hypothetical protein